MSSSTATAGRAMPMAPSAQTDKAAISIRHYLIILAQLGLLLLVLRQFQIESAAFLRLALVAFGGFAVYAWLPLQLRLAFFVVLSLAGTVLVLGFENASWLIGIGLVLIGICHIPVAFWMRGTALIVVCAVLAAMRAKWMPFPWSEAIWPILGSMFMFRLIVYFYDLKHDKVPGTPLQALGYFFMMPNACFPLFPVVDYKAFRRAYFDDDAYRTYQVGVDWMVRGAIHLILYRIVYYHFVLAPSEVSGPGELVQYLIANFLLYLRVSGLFHLIVGMLYLYGFRLSETHNRYLLAASFTDFWRRINIYWKDFMQKIFYYPAIFKLKKLGATQAMVIATLYVFVMTWFLHAYQWFWLRGTALFVAQDILFWTILGVLVVFNSLYEIKHGRARAVAQGERTHRQLMVSVLKSYGTFWFICVLWSFWTSESLHEWASLWKALGGKFSWGVIGWPLAILAVIALGSIPRDTLRNMKLSAQDDREWARSRVVTVLMLFGLIAISVEALTQRFGNQVASFVHSVRTGQLSRLDLAKLEQGYYENLLSVDRFNSQLWEVYSKKPANWLDMEYANLKRFVGGFGQVELIPSFVSRTKYGEMTINQWGMRDQDYPKQPAAGTFRMAVLGPSTVMGWGVSDGQTFEALVEDRLNREQTARGFKKYELLNFAVPGYQPPQQLVAFEKALGFAPDALLFIATGREMTRSANYLSEVIRKRIEIPYPDLKAIVDKSGATPDMPETEVDKRLAPFKAEMLAIVYGRIAEQARSRGITPVLAFLPQVRSGTWTEETPDTLAIARQARFAVIDLSAIYQDQDIAAIRLAEWDDHPNAQGHQLVADRLYAALLKLDADLFKPAGGR